MRRLLLAAALAVALLGVPVPPAARAAPSDVRIPLAQGPQPWTFVGGSGSQVVARDAHDRHHVSLDNGATWADAPTPDAPAHVGNGRYVVLDTTTSPAVVRWWALDGSARGTFTVSAEGEPVAVTATHVLLRGAYDKTGTPYRVQRLDTGAVQELGSWTGRVLLGRTAALHTSYTSTTSGGTVAATIIPFSGASATSFTWDGVGYRGYEVVGDELRYAVVTASGVQSCQRALTATATACVTLTTNPAGLSWADIGGTADVSLVSLRYSDAPQRVWRVAQGVATEVKLPPNDDYVLPAASDTTLPVLALAGTRQVSWFVAPSGATTRLPTPVGPVVPMALALTPGRVSWLDTRPDGTALGQAQWVRDLEPAVGEERLLAARANLRLGGTALSADRVATATTAGDVALYQGTAPARRLTLGSLTDASGSWVLSGGVVYDTQGAVVYRPTNGSVTHLFGSRAMVQPRGRGVPTLVDVRDGAAVWAGTPVLPDVDVLAVGTWGSWFVTLELAAAGELPYTLVATDVSTGERVTRPFDAFPDVGDVGDGWVVVDDGIWRLDDDELMPDPTGTGARFATDRVSRIAFVDGVDLVIRTLDGVGTSPARALAVQASGSLVAGGSWTLEVEATKALGAGSLVVKDAAGAVVGAVPTAATTSGAVRGVAWDGRTPAGTLVSAGTYTWEFSAPGADGTGPLTAIDGTGPVRGTLTVSRAPTFVDVPVGTQFFDEIEWLAGSGISTGWTTTGGSEFRPTQPVNRDAMAAFLYRYAGSPAYTPPATSPFLDVTPTTQFYKEICWLASKGISTGWDAAGGREFRPTQPVNRDTMAAFMYRFAGVADDTPPATSPFLDITPTTQFYREICWLASKGISTGWDATGGREFRPAQPVNRDAMAAFMFRLGRLGVR